ncbi:hypothetical protein DFH09DRAFT_1277598 [Mycena vulgaris]|nr:hypothetical protein DFH09DRAFT_1277598 [Mycena vulgaris]
MSNPQVESRSAFLLTSMRRRFNRQHKQAFRISIAEVQFNTDMPSKFERLNVENSYVEKSYVEAGENRMRREERNKTLRQSDSESTTVVAWLARGNRETRGDIGGRRKGNGKEDARSAGMGTQGAMGDRGGRNEGIRKNNGTERAASTLDLLVLGVHDARVEEARVRRGDVRREQQQADRSSPGPPRRPRPWRRRWRRRGIKLGRRKRVREVNAPEEAHERDKGGRLEVQRKQRPQNLEPSSFHASRSSSASRAQMGRISVAESSVRVLFGCGPAETKEGSEEHRERYEEEEARGGNTHFARQDMVGGRVEGVALDLGSYVLSHRVKARLRGVLIWQAGQLRAGCQMVTSTRADVDHHLSALSVYCAAKPCDERLRRHGHNAYKICRRFASAPWAKE